MKQVTFLRCLLGGRFCSCCRINTELLRIVGNKKGVTDVLWRKVIVYFLVAFRWKLLQNLSSKNARFLIMSAVTKLRIWRKKRGNRNKNTDSWSILFQKPLVVKMQNKNSRSFSLVKCRLLCTAEIIIFSKTSATNSPCSY